MRDIDVLWRRIVAYLFDCTLIAIFAICLGLVVVTLSNVFSLPSIVSAFQGHAIAFLTLTFPALIYFAKTESSIKQASFGKKLLGLKVQNLKGARTNFRQAFFRVIILLFPWELAHIGIWYGAERPFIDQPTNWALAIMIMAQLILVIYLVSAIFSPKAAIHDKIAKLRIVRN